MESAHVRVPELGGLYFEYSPPRRDCYIVLETQFGKEFDFLIMFAVYGTVFFFADQIPPPTICCIIVMNRLLSMSIGTSLATFLQAISLADL